MQFPKLAVVFLVAALSGCAAKFTFIDRADGQIYSGVTDGGTMSGSGNASLQIEGETYTGPWIYQASGGSFGFSNFGSTSTAYGSATNIGGKAMNTTTLSGTGTTSGSSTAIGVTAVGNGMINARASSGRFIRCVFTFNTMNNTGIGECLRNDGRAYDLNVKR